MSSVIQVNRIYLIFNPVHFLVDSSDENSIINGVDAASQYGKMSVKLTLQDNQEYIFTPKNMIPSDFERYTMNMGFKVEKRPNSDTIFLIKDNAIKKICIIQKP